LGASVAAALALGAITTDTAMKTGTAGIIGDEITIQTTIVDTTVNVRMMMARSQSLSGATAKTETKNVSALENSSTSASRRKRSFKSFTKLLKRNDVAVLRRKRPRLRGGGMVPWLW
jgi:hypothetical protein